MFRNSVLRKFILVACFTLVSGAFELPSLTQAPSAAAARRRRPAVRVSADVSIFYDQLAPYGEWLQVEPYGYCWTPYDIPRNWRPYYVGHWGWADECGWTWVSDCDCDQEWAWAAYHYGRWFFDDDYGWVWVPDRTWGPSWVAWRESDNYVGWAPLPPDVRWRDEQGLVGLSSGPDPYNIDPFWWNFVDTDRFVSPRVYEYCVPPARNVRLIDRSHNVTKYIFENNYVVSRPFDVRHVRQFTNTDVPRIHLRQIDNVRDIPHGTISGNDVPVYRRRLAPAPQDRTPPRILEHKTASRGGSSGPSALPGSGPSSGPRPPSVGIPGGGNAPGPGHQGPGPGPSSIPQPGTQGPRPSAPGGGGLTPPKGPAAPPSAPVQTQPKVAPPVGGPTAPASPRPIRGPQDLGKARTEQLQQQQSREAQKPPSGVTAEQLNQQHEAERKAQQDLQSREDQVFERRQQKIRGGGGPKPGDEKPAAAPAPAHQTPQTPGRGQPGPGLQGKPKP